MKKTLKLIKQQDEEIEKLKKKYKLNFLYITEGSIVAEHGTTKVNYYDYLSEEPKIENLCTLTSEMSQEEFIEKQKNFKEEEEHLRTVVDIFKKALKQKETK